MANKQVFDSHAIIMAGVAGLSAEQSNPFKRLRMRMPPDTLRGDRGRLRLFPCDKPPQSILDKKKSRSRSAAYNPSFIDSS